MIKSQILFYIFILAFWSCRNRDSNEAVLKVIPSSPAEDGQFPSLAHFFDCTGVKIDKASFLTSAACVFDFKSQNLKLEARPGTIIPFSHGTNTIQNQNHHKIKTIILHESFHKFALSTTNAPIDIDDYGQALDLAIVVFEENFPEIAIAEIASLKNEQPLPETALVAGYGLSLDPFAETEVAGNKAEIVDLNWNRFKIKMQDENRFYADSQDRGTGSEVVKLLAADRGAPVFLDQVEKPFNQLIGLATGSDFSGKSNFISLNHKLASCILEALKKSKQETLTDKNYAIFCQSPD